MSHPTALPQMIASARCPCRKKSETITYADCCMPFHTGLSLAPTATALMRSRYSAFALENVTYLRATWHPTTRPPQLTFTPGQQWLLLRILNAQSEAAYDTVEFIARSRIDGTIHTLHEISKFARDGIRWFYVDGKIK
jgi:SEC-C motif domain protein